MAIAPLLSAGMFLAEAAPRVSASSLSLRILDVAGQYFGLGQGVFFLGYGAKELIVDACLQKWKIKPLDPGANWPKKVVHNIQKLCVQVFAVHGTLYVLSAAAWIAAELDTLKYIRLGTFLPLIQSVGNVLFLGACALAIGHQALIYKEAVALSKEEKNLATRLKTSALIGIIGNIGYIAATTLLIFGGPVVAIAVLGFLAVTIGCVKVYYDFRRLTPVLEQTSQ